MRLPFNPRSTFNVLFLLAGTLLWTGCETLGTGITKREFNQAWSDLAVGQTQSDILAKIGEPRERRRNTTQSEYDEVWIYSQLEKVGERTEITEGAVGPGGVGIPTYEQVAVREIIQYHLRWQEGSLVSWERIED